MKLFELDDLFAHPATKDVARKQQQAPSHKQVGKGGYAYVGTDDDDNFGDVHRVADFAEGGSTFLRAVFADKRTHYNAFFPKVRSVVNNQHTTVVITERLLPFTSTFSDELVVAVGTRYFEEYQKLIKEPMINFELSHHDAFVYTLAQSFYHPDTIKLPQLKAAVSWIKTLAQTHPGSMYDIHSGNIMWRPGQYQPQLVFTDPIDIDYVDDDDPDYFGD